MKWKTNLILMLTFFLFVIPSVLGTIYHEQNFDSCTVNTSGLCDFDNVGTTGAPTVRYGANTNYSVSTPNSYEIYETLASARGVYANVSSNDGYYWIEYDFYAERCDSAGWLSFPYAGESEIANADGKYIDITMFTSTCGGANDLRAFNGTGHIDTGGTVLIDTWYNFKLEINNTADTYQLFLDDVDLGTYDFRTAPSDIDYFSPYSIRTAEYYYDNICISDTLGECDRDVLLHAPANNTNYTTDTNITFQTNATGTGWNVSANITCDLTIDGTINETKVFIGNASQNWTNPLNFTPILFTQLLGIDVSHQWNTTCRQPLNVSSTETWNFTIEGVPPTKLEHIEVDITDTIFNSADDLLVLNQTINVTGNRTLLFTGVGNIQKVSGSSPSTFSVRIDFEGSTIFNNSLRTVSGTDDIGIANIDILRYENADNENASLLVYYRETGSGSMNITNFDLDIISDTTFDQNVINNSYFNESINVTNTSFQNYVNFTHEKNIEGYTLFDIHTRVSDDTSLLSCYLETPDNFTSPLLSRTIGVGGDIGSGGLKYFDEINRTGNQTYKFYCKTNNTGIVTNITAYAIDLMNNESNFIHTESSINTSSNFSANYSLGAGDHVLTQIINFTAFNSSFFHTSGIINFQSNSGLQTPTFYLQITNGTDTINSSMYLRTLNDNDDVGNGKIYGDFNINGTPLNISLHTIVDTGENLSIVDEGLFVMEIVALDDSLGNITILDSNVTNLNIDFNVSFCTLNTNYDVDINFSVVGNTIGQGNYSLNIPTGCSLIAGSNNGTFLVDSGSSFNDTLTYACTSGDEAVFIFNVTNTGDALQSINSTLACTGGAGGLDPDESSCLTTGFLLNGSACPNGIIQEAIEMLWIIFLLLGLLVIGFWRQKPFLITAVGLGLMFVGYQFFDADDTFLKFVIIGIGVFLAVISALMPMKTES